MTILTFCANGRSSTSFRLKDLPTYAMAVWNGMGNYFSRIKTGMRLLASFVVKDLYLCFLGVVGL